MPKAIRWSDSVHTPRSRRLLAQRLGRRRRRRLDVQAEARHVIDLMSEGARLNLAYDRRRQVVWHLSVVGVEVPDEIARVVIASEQVVAVGDTLFEGMLSQTYRYCEI
jgi:superfamily II DNA or RNA helicase